MRLAFTPQAWSELQDWVDNNNKAITSKIFQLINAIQKDPFKGIGKPEALRHNLKGYWSRRINKEHRLIYKVSNDIIKILSLKGHYE